MNMLRSFSFPTIPVPLQRVARHGPIVLLGLAYVLHSLFRYFDHDEIEAVHTGWKILQGQRIYADFFQHHHEAAYHLLAALLAIGDDNAWFLLCIRLVFLGMCGGIVFLTWLLARDLLESRAAAASAVVVLLGMEMFCSAAVEIRPDVPQVLCCMMAFWFFFRQIRGGGAVDFVLGGTSLAFSFLFLQKAVIAVVLVHGLQLLAVRKGLVRVRHAVIHLAAFLCTLAPYAFHLWSNGSLRDYVFWNWTLNFAFSCPDTDSFFLVQSLVLNAPFWILFVAGVVLAARDGSFAMKTAVGMACMLLASLLLYKVRYQQYFMPVFPFLAIVAAYALHRFVRRDAVLHVVLAVSCLVPLGKFSVELATRNNLAQLAKISYVVENTRPDDFVYDGDARFNIFRHDIGYFWYSVRSRCSGLAAYRVLGRGDYDIVENIARQRPRVASSYGIDPAALQGYAVSRRYDDLYWRCEDGSPLDEGGRIQGE